MTPSHIIAGALLAAVPLLANAGTELYSPSLPADPTQYLECRILNVSAVPQKVRTTAFMGNAVVAAGPYPQVLAPGESGGFSVPGFYAGMYCKFEVSGTASDFRASIDIFEVTGGGSRIFNALSAY